MFAIIETGGKQYKVAEQDVIYIERLNQEETDVEFKVVALSTDEGFKVGTPIVEGAVVKGEIIEHGNGKKIYVIKYKAKKNEKKKIGHRQPFTKVKITSITG